MLDTFKARLKAKSTAAGANLSQKRLDAIADKLHKKFPELTDEAEHDTHIEDLYDAETLKEFSRLDDYERTKAAREQKEAKEKEKSEKKEEKQEQKGEETATERMLRELLENQKTLSERLQSFEKEKTLGTIKQQLQEKLKDVPASIWSKRQLPETPEAIEAFVTEVNTDYQEDFINKGLVTNPGSGKSGKASNGKATPEEVKSIVKGIMPKV